MAWARDAGAGGLNTHAQSGSYTIGGGSNRLLIIGAFNESGTAPTIDSATFNGVSATAVGAQVENPSDSHHLRMFYLLEADLPAAGSYTAAWAGTNTSDEGIGATSYSGVAQTAPDDVQSNSSDAAGDSTLNFTGTSLGGLGVDAVLCNGARTFTEGTNQTALFENSLSNYSFTMTDKSLASGSDSMSNDWNGSPSAVHQGAVWSEASSANEMSGTPQAQAADAAGTMQAPASAAGTPQAGAATAAGTLKHVSAASGAPQAGAATAAGTATVRAQLSGSPQAGVAVGDGAMHAPAAMSGAPQAGAAVGEGTAEVLVQLSGAPEADPATADGTATFGESINVSGSPQADPAEGAGTLSAPASASGTPSAAAAEGAGTLQRRFSAAGTPQADAATSDGSMAVLLRLSGAPSADLATAAGILLALASMAGTPAAAPATSTGTVGVVVSMSGAVQAGLATTSGFADDGSTPITTPKRPPLMLTNVGRLGQ